MRSGKKKKSSTEKEGEYTKKSRGTPGGRPGDGGGRRGDGRGTAGDGRGTPVHSYSFLIRLIEDPSTFRCLGNFRN